MSDLKAAQQAFADFVHALPRNGRIVGLHDVDADGISAGVIWQRVLERLGFAHAKRLSRTGSAMPGRRATRPRLRPPTLTLCSCSIWVVRPKRRHGN